MMSICDDDAKFYALVSCRCLKPRQLFQLFIHFPTLDALLEASANQLGQIGHAKRLSSILNAIDVHQAREQLRQIAARGISWVTITNENYPERLRHISDPPLMLFYKGEFSLLSAPRILSVVGARQMTAYGAFAIKKLIPTVVQRGIVVMSGMANGVDQEAQKKALDCGGRVVAVQAQGVDQGYPQAQRHLYDQILAAGGCVVSEYPYFGDDEKVMPYHFPQRNRLVSGLADGVLVIEAKRKSGSLITADFAMEQGRDVYAVPGNLDQELSAGCLDLIHDGALVVREANDIFSSDASVGVAKQQSLSFEDDTKQLTLNGLEKNLYQHCQMAPQTLDDLVEKTGESVSSVMVTLTRMELTGCLRQNDQLRYICV